jgi:hypothetical protein
MARRGHGEPERTAGLVDMRLDFEFADKVLLRVGGVWDRRLGDYVGDAKTGVAVRVHAGQRDSVTWFRRWLCVHAGRRDTPPVSVDIDAEIESDPSEVYSALLAGGRRGGKTWIGAAFCAAYAVQFPNAIVWVVSPSRGRDDTKADELRRYLINLLAPEWIARQTVATGWELINGSVIALKSAYVGADPDAIKEGEAHVIWLNEAQKMAPRVYTVARGAISDRSGLVLCCANPPVEAKDHQWVSDFAADAQAGRRASVYYHMNPLDNPHINRRALLSMRAEVDERTFAIEVLGQFLGPPDAVAYNWVRLENERVTPAEHDELVDVTAEFLAIAEEGEGICDLVGLDVQRIPYIGGPVYRFFCKRGESPTRDNVIAWIVGEVVLDGGDELEWCGELQHSGFDPATTLIVCDATGEYQHSRRRSADSPPPEWKGRGSFDIIRSAGYRRIVPPSRMFRRKNPEIVDRIRAMTSMICDGLGRRRLFVDRDKAPRSCAAIRDWRTVHGKPSRIQDVAHLGDGVSYPLIRLFPRILRSGNTGPMQDPIAQRVDREGGPLNALTPPPSAGRRGQRGRGL